MKTIEAKAIRLIAEDRVQVGWVGEGGLAATGSVEGDTGTYQVAFSPETQVCTCPAAIHRCSHVIALELAVIDP